MGLQRIRGFLDIHGFAVDYVRLPVGGKIYWVDAKRGAGRLAGDMPFKIKINARLNSCAILHQAY